MTFLRVLLLPALLLSASVAPAAPEPGDGYLLRAIDGENVLGEDFTLVPKPSGGWVGFFYLADEGRLVSSRCTDSSCSDANALTGPLSERGQYVSGAHRPGINRPIAAFYDAAAGALMAFDCLVAECQYGSTRTLDDDGNVGQDTATAIDPATGRALVSYYDVGNARLKLYRCDNDACSSGAAVVVDGTAGRGRASRMAFAGSRLWIAYEDAVAGEVRLAYAEAPFTAFTSFAVGPGAEPEAIATAGPALELLWRNTADHSLERLRCLDADCATTQHSTIAAAGRGYSPTATRTPSGQTLVAHHAPAEGLLLATLCDDQDCGMPSLLEFGSAPALAGRAQPGVLAGSNLPVVFHYNGDTAAIDASRCSSMACSGVVRRVAFDGVPAGAVRVALRGDAPPVLAYIRQREPWLALCSDARCSEVARFALPGGNSDQRPALGLRPDGSPFVYFSNFGGSLAYDCADAACSDGAPREVTGTGNSTSDTIELALRGDGRPVLLYSVGNQAAVHLFLCADASCSTGTARLLADEADGAFLGGFAVVVGPGDRPIVLYSVHAPGGALQRYVRCDDSSCASATVATLANRGSLGDTPLALRSDGRPVFVESASFAPSLALCNDADCTAVETMPIPTGGGVRALQLDAADRPVLMTTSGGTASLVRCADPLCSDATSALLLADADSLASFAGSMALDGSGRAAAALEDTSQQDVMLVLPAPPAGIFGDGFEP